MTQRTPHRFGLLVPFTNTNFEPDMALMCPNAITLYTTRMGGYDEDEIPDANQMRGLGAADLDAPLHLLMGSKPDVILYGCTSATLTHGPEFDRALAARIRKDSGAYTVTAAGALINALKNQDISRIGFASPYVPAINDMAINYLSHVGIGTVTRSEVTDTLDNTGQGALTPEAVFDLGCKADHPSAQAVVLSCTDMRSVEVIDRLEQALGKPVITSNQAMLFKALQLLKLKTPIPGFGRLLADSTLREAPNA